MKDANEQAAKAMQDVMPKPIYSCADENCATEQSFSASDIFWCPELEGWYCDNCIHYSVEGRTIGISLEAYQKESCLAIEGRIMSEEKDYDWMDEALEIAGQCWCDEETSSITMNVPLATAVAKRIALWMQTAAQNQRNTDYYRNIVYNIGELFGDEAKTADDGTVMEDVLAARVYDLVKNALR